jgi:TolA-binding protein
VLLDVARLWLGDATMQDAETARVRAQQAYERVAVEFADMPEAAEALYRLVRLHEQADQPQEARKARARLLRAYPASPWARQLEAGPQ